MLSIDQFSKNRICQVSSKTHRSNRTIYILISCRFRGLYKIWYKMLTQLRIPQSNGLTERTLNIIYNTFYLIFFFPQILNFAWNFIMFLLKNVKISSHITVTLNSIVSMVMCNSFLKWKQKWKYHFEFEVYWFVILCFISVLLPFYGRQAFHCYINI